MTALEFQETMAGWMALGAASFEEGREKGEQAGSSLDFTVTITAADLDAVNKNPATACAMTGVVHAPALSPDPLRVVAGTFKLMEFDLDQVETAHMRYQMDLEATDGTAYELTGFKVIRTEPPWRAWPATTTLFVTVTGGGHDPGLGILTISASGFASLLRSMRVEPARPRWRALKARAHFGRVFAGRLVRRYATTLDLDSRYGPGEPEPPTPRDLRTPIVSTHWRDGDGDWHEGQPGADANLMLSHIPGGTKGPVLLAPGFAMQAASFAATTVPTTLAEFLAEAGYDVWLFDYRASIALPTCTTSFSIDEVAKDDWPAAVDQVRSLAQVDSVQALGHCVGSVSLLMALLAGMEGVRSAVCSQFTVHPHTGWLNRTKNAIRVTAILELLRLRGVEDDATPTAPNKALDVLLSVVPTPPGERCGRPVCRWLNATYGLTHTHSQLNHATHEMLDEAFGFGNLTGLQHLALMNRRRHVVDRHGGDTYLPNVAALSMPILFLQGSKNTIFRPEGTQETVRWIQRNVPGGGAASYLELPTYAHLDTMIGRNAAVEVFPSLVAHLDASNP